MAAKETIQGCEVGRLGNALDHQQGRTPAAALDLFTAVGVVTIIQPADTVLEGLVHLDAGVAAVPSRSWKEPVQVATAAALPAYTRTGNVLEANANGALPNIDGTAVGGQYRILVKNGASGIDNGIYVVTSPGTGGSHWILTRATDFDQDADVRTNVITLVMGGTANGGKAFRLSTVGVITINATAMTFTEFPPAGTSLGTDAGWTALSGTGDRNTGGYDTSTISLEHLAQIVKAMLDAHLATKIEQT